MEIWKEFEQNEITHSAAHYLMTINRLIDDQGYARVSDVARSLSITAGSASIMLKNLKEKGFLIEDKNRFVKLSEPGDRLAHSIKSHRHIIITFFRDVLHINPEQAEIDACKIEHLISTETGEHLLWFLQFLMCGDAQAKAFLDLYWESKDKLCNMDSCPVCDKADECLLVQVENPEADID